MTGYRHSPELIGVSKTEARNFIGLKNWKN